MICSDASMTCVTVTPSRHVYPIGHLARPQGLQCTGFASTRNEPSCNGPYLCGLLAPNMVTVGVPKAYAIWAGPVSLVTKTDSRAITAPSMGNDVFPITFRQGSPTCFDRAIPVARSCAAALQPCRSRRRTYTDWRTTAPPGP